MAIRNIFFLLFAGGLFTQATCGKMAANVFGPRTPRDAYAQQLDKKGLDETPAGRRWLAAAEAALVQPVAVRLPYKQKGRFRDTLPVALGLQFKAMQGERLTFTIDKEVQQPFALYAELFLQDAAGTRSLQYAADTTASTFSFDIATEGTYLLRLQTQLDRGGSYALSINTGPSIGFPVSDPKANIGSFWGAPRDGGKRNHEGIDIFARKGSPVVAAVDGMVTSAQEGGIGGKVVWLRAEGKNYTLYYAHLDSHMVQTGQQVRQGDQLGTVGNTGNARTTPAHLHFGIYTYTGPIDPLPYVKKGTRQAGEVPQRSLAGMLKVVQPQKAGMLSANTLLTPLGVNGDGYLAVQPDGRVVLAPFSSVKLVAAASAAAIAARSPLGSGG